MYRGNGAPLRFEVAMSILAARERAIWVTTDVGQHVGHPREPAQPTFVLHLLTPCGHAIANVVEPGLRPRRRPGDLHEGRRERVAADGTVGTRAHHEADVEGIDRCLPALVVLQRTHDGSGDEDVVDGSAEGLARSLHGIEGQP